MKFLLGFCLLLLLATVILSKSARFGRRVPGDILLYREDVERFPIRSRVQDYYLAYPPRAASEKVIVTAIYVYDHFTNRSGAKPQLIENKLSTANGDSKSYKILLRSKRSHGINSTVDFFGTFNRLLDTENVY